jgi:hypothetical protein
MFSNSWCPKSSVSELLYVLICLSFSAGPPMQGNTNNYSGGGAVSAIPSMAKNDPTSTSSNVCKVKAMFVR